MHIQGDDRRNSGNDALDKMRIVTQLKDVAIDQNCAVVVLHHLSTEDAQKFFPGHGQKKPNKNLPPSLDSISWSKNLRLTVDMWLALCPDWQADVTADQVEMVQWLMKDKKSARLKSEIHLWYDKKQQWFYDNTTRHLMPSYKKQVPQMPLGTP